MIDGRVQYLFHGYTTSSHYPYSAPVRMGGRRVNYVRASAYAAVDAFSGRVSVYAGDSAEPILRAWREAFPGLFLPFVADAGRDARAPALPAPAVRRRRPRAYATYHASDPTGFWNGADAWQRPQQLAGPVEVRRRDPLPGPGGIDADERREKGLTPERSGWTPATCWPGSRATGASASCSSRRSRQRGRQNLASYLAGSIDDDGRPRLVAAQPAARPAHARPRAGHSPDPRQARRSAGGFSSLNRESRDLGKAAVSRTVLGTPRVVPVGDTLVHVQPVYLARAETACRGCSS